MQVKYSKLGISYKNIKTEEICDAYVSLRGCRWSEPGDVLLKHNYGGEVNWTFLRNVSTKVINFNDWKLIIERENDEACREKETT